MVVFLTVLATVIYTAQSLAGKVFSGSYPGESSDTTPVYAAMTAAATAVGTLIVIGFDFDAAPLTWLMGIVNAVALIGYHYLFITASKSGPYSIVMTANVAGGIIAPALMGVIGFGDELKIIQYIAMVLVVVTIYPVCLKKEKSQRPKPVFYLYCAGLFVCNGIYNSLLNAQQRLTGVAEKEEMIILTFGITSIICLVWLLIKKKSRVLGAFRMSRKSLIALIVGMAIFATAVHLYTYLMQFVNMAILATVVNAGILVLSIFASWLVYREKISLTNLIGTVFMCVGIACMAM